MSAISSRESSHFHPHSGGRSIGLPQTLHTLLEDAEARGETDIISWVHNGTGYKVHKKDEFVEKVMPRYFETSTYKSYQRSVNLWNFETVRKGPNKGFTSHPFFRRGNRDLCKGMKRIRVKGNGKKRTPASPSTKFVPPIKQHYGFEQTLPMPAKPQVSSLLASSQNGREHDFLTIDRLLAEVSEAIKPSTMNMESLRMPDLSMDRLLAEVSDVIKAPVLSQARTSLSLSSLMGSMQRRQSLPTSSESLADTRIAEYVKHQQLRAAMSRAVAPADDALAAAARMLQESQQQKQQLIDTAAAALLARGSHTQGYLPLGGNPGALVPSHANGVSLSSFLHRF